LKHQKLTFSWKKTLCEQHKKDEDDHSVEQTSSREKGAEFSDFLIHKNMEDMTVPLEFLCGLCHMRAYCDTDR